VREKRRGDERQSNRLLLEKGGGTGLDLNGPLNMQGEERGKFIL